MVGGALAIPPTLRGHSLACVYPGSLPITGVCFLSWEIKRETEPQEPLPNIVSSRTGRGCSELRPTTVIFVIGPPSDTWGSCHRHS